MGADVSDAPAARLGVKVYLDVPAELDAEPAIGIFHGWIQRDALEGILIDVADYRHVHHGPAVMLIGHERDLVLDMGEGRPGLACIDKRGDAETLSAQVVGTARHAIAAAELLAEEPAIAVRGVGDGEVRVAILDRLRAPSGGAGEAATRGAVEAAAAELFPGEDVSVEAVADPGGPVAFRIIAGAPVRA